jgi:hypothetical protein
MEKKRVETIKTKRIKKLGPKYVAWAWLKQARYMYGLKKRPGWMDAYA